MPEVSRDPIVWLDREALRSNIETAKALCGTARLMVAVKSNAYGLGADLIVPEIVASGADELAVLDIETAVAIRPLAADTPLFAWLLSPDSDFAAALAAKVELGISAAWQLEAIASHNPQRAATVHLKIDTGLHRNGARPEDWPELVSLAAQLEHVGVVRVRAVWSHLADTSDETTLEALKHLQLAAKVARDGGLQPEMLHLAASHAAIDLPQTRLDMVRLGILAYGITPFADRSAEDLGYAPVLTLSAPVIDRGEVLRLGIGYGHGLIPPVERDARMTILGASYRIVDMGVDYLDLVGVDATSMPEPGTQVALLGGADAAMRVEGWARLAHTIGDEVVAHLDPSLERRWISASARP